MRMCWAGCLGDCSEKISGEHVITDGVFPADEVKVKGLPWCLDEFKTIGLASFVKKVLCVEHNSRLSEADNAAIGLRKAICDSASLSEARKLMPPQDWRVDKFSVNGFGLERWCLKTLITIAVDGQVPIGDGDSQPGKPSRALVETAFGLRQFQPPRAGLYWIGEAGDTVSAQEGVVVTTFSNQANRLGGARFWFWGLNLLLILEDGPTGPFSFTSPTGEQMIQPNVLYRPRRLNIGVHDRLSHVLEFVW
jgi:hypothetical protein